MNTGRLQKAQILQQTNCTDSMSSEKVYFYVQKLSERQKICHREALR